MSRQAAARVKEEGKRNKRGLVGLSRKGEQRSKEDKDESGKSKWKELEGRK